MLPTPEIRLWSSRARLISVRRRRRAATNASSEKTGSIGSRAMCAISAWAAPPRPAETDSPPKVRWSTKRSSGPSSANSDPDAQVRLVRRAGRAQQQLAGHAQVADHRVAAVQGQPQVLAPPTDVGDRSGRPAGRRSRPARQVPAYRPRVAHPTAAIRRPTTHGPALAGRSPPRAAQAPTAPASASRGRPRRRRPRLRLGPRGASVVGEHPPGRLGGPLLGLLLAAALRPAVSVAGDHHPGGERLQRGPARPARSGTPARPAPAPRSAPAGWSSSPGRRPGRRTRPSAGRTAGGSPWPAVSSPYCR